MTTDNVYTEGKPKEALLTQQGRVSCQSLKHLSRDHVYKELFSVKSVEALLKVLSSWVH